MMLVAVAVVVMVFAGFSYWRLASAAPVPVEAPEAQRVLAAQEQLDHFGILIPAYLPKEFNRANVDVSVKNNGPSGETGVDLVYRTGKGETLFIRQWVPANPALETLAGSRPIQTKWGKSWLLTQGRNLIALWVDIGQLRVSLSTHNIDRVSREQLVLTGPQRYCPPSPHGKHP